MDEVKILTDMGFEMNLDCLDSPDPDTVLATVYGWQVIIEYQAVCIFKQGLWLSFSHSHSLDYDEFVAEIRRRLRTRKTANKPKQLALFSE